MVLSPSPRPAKAPGHKSRTPGLWQGPKDKHLSPRATPRLRPNRILSAGAQPPNPLRGNPTPRQGPAPVSPGTCSSRPRAGALLLFSWFLPPPGPQFSAAPPNLGDTSGLALCGWGCPQPAPRVRRGAPGEREPGERLPWSAALASPGRQREREEATTWTHLSALLPGTPPTCSGRAAGSWERAQSFRGGRSFGRQPRANPAVRRQFWPRLGGAGGGLLLNLSLDPGFSGNSGNRFSFHCSGKLRGCASDGFHFCFGVLWLPWATNVKETRAKTLFREKSLKHEVGNELKKMNSPILKWWS